VIALVLKLRLRKVPGKPVAAIRTAGLNPVAINAVRR
jgi:hypothetical protein